MSAENYKHSSMRLALACQIMNERHTGRRIHQENGIAHEMCFHLAPTRAAAMLLRASKIRYRETAANETRRVNEALPPGHRALYWNDVRKAAGNTQLSKGWNSKQLGATGGCLITSSCCETRRSPRERPSCGKQRVS